MNYETAKQLKEAGCPEGSGKLLPSDTDTSNWKIPTLSELIDACVKSFGKEYEQFRLEYWMPSREWKCQADFELVTDGETPEEAVAKLWLELNDK